MRINIRSARFRKWVLLSFLGLLFFCFLFYLSVYLGMWGNLPTSEELRELKQSEATEIYDDGGILIGKYYIFDRQPVIFEELPQHLIDALVATEDVRFYEHSGIDNRSLLRVFFKTILLQDESSGGGSTITLQLAKNLFGRNRYGALSMVVNKLRESIIARRLEKLYTKQEILTLYLNTVPFSDNTYGIESAARKFFSTTTAHLTLEQAATLVGSLKATHYYNPRIFPERAQLRRNIVLRQMAKYDLLSQDTLDSTRKEPLELAYQYFNYHEGVAPYFRERLRQDALKILDTLETEDGTSYNLYHDGLQIHTTLNRKMQLMAEEAMKEHMTHLQEQFEQSHGHNGPWTRENLLREAIEGSRQYRSLKDAGWSETRIMDSLNRKREMELFGWGKKEIKAASVVDSLQHYMKFLNVGMLNLDPNTGAVKSWVGGINFENFKYDHVAQSSRQVGSTFKPVVYTAALETGIDPCTYYSAREVTYEEGWTPSNTSEEEDPYMNYSMEAALSQSMNTIAVKVLFDAGLDKVISQTREMGIRSPLPKYPSLALGTAEMSVKELAAAYTSFANRGVPSKPYYITRITDKHGKTLVNLEPENNARPAFSNTTRQIILEMMKTTVEEGTAARLRHTYQLPNDIAGKTGTTQDNKDGWFVGVTPNLVSVTWVGADDHRIGFRTTALGQGASSALPIFGRMMQKMNADPDFNDITQATFPPPSETVRMLMDCEPTKRDNFLERLFTNPDKQEKREQAEEKEEKKGLFSRIKGLFKKKDN